MTEVKEDPLFDYKVLLSMTLRMFVGVDCPQSTQCQKLQWGHGKYWAIMLQIRQCRRGEIGQPVEYATSSGKQADSLKVLIQKADEELS
jgi:hypothetical protein